MDADFIAIITAGQLTPKIGKKNKKKKKSRWKDQSRVLCELSFGPCFHAVYHADM